MLYYRNRLVESFRCSELQHVLDADDFAKLRKEGVVLIADLDGVRNVEVTANKDSFDDTNGFHDLMARFRDKCAEFLAVKGGAGPSRRVRHWILCDTCGKWRTSTEAIVKAHADKRFICELNDAKCIRNCNVPEEDFDEDLEVSSQRARPTRCEGPGSR
jgi:hypothetical protein